MNTNAPGCETCPVYNPLRQCAEVLGQLAAPAVEAAEMGQAQSHIANEMLAEATEVVLNTSLNPDSKDRTDALELLEAGVPGAWDDFQQNNAAAQQRRAAAAKIAHETEAGLGSDIVKATLLQSGAKLATTNVQSLEQNCAGQKNPHRCAAPRPAQRYAKAALRQLRSEHPTLDL
jgi:hypothetical protein